MIVTLLVAFVLELVLRNFAGIDVIMLLALDPVHLGPATLIQLFSYPFIEQPNAVMSMLIGLLFMWLIMSPFEASFGARRTLELSLFGVLGAGTAAIVAAQIVPIEGYRFLGSHPIAYAGMSAMATVMKRGRIMFFGAIPMTSQQLIWLLAGLSLLQFLASKDHVMLAGSLGAIGAGIGYVRYMSRTPRAPRKARNSSPRLRVVRGGGESSDPNDRPKWLN